MGDRADQLQTVVILISHICRYNWADEKQYLPTDNQFPLKFVYTSLHLRLIEVILFWFPKIARQHIKYLYIQYMVSLDWRSIESAALKLID